MNRPAGLSHFGPASQGAAAQGLHADALAEKRQLGDLAGAVRLRAPLALS